MSFIDARTERVLFGIRLREVLPKAGVPSGQKEFAQAFNSKAGSLCVSKGCARKWLLGITIPSHARLRILAEMLRVSPDWLRHGEASDLAPIVFGHSFSLDLQLLSIEDQHLVRELIDVLLKASSK